MYGTNDADREWYLAIRVMLLDTGWEALVHEPASFAMRDATSDTIAFRVLHDGDFLTAILPDPKESMLGHFRRKVDVRSLRSCQQEAVTFCGRE